MIRTRFDQSDKIVGSGPYTMSLTEDELLLMTMFVGMVRFGHGKYEQAAMKLMTTIEELGNDTDRDIFEEAFEAIPLSVLVRNSDTGDVENVLEADHLFEFCV